MMYQDRQGVVGVGGGGGGSTPHGIILAVVVALVVLVPFFLGDSGEAITDAIAELLSPVGLLLLPIVLLLTIQFLSSERGSFVSAIFSTGEPESIHRVSGSPVGVALFLVLILFLLYHRFSIFGGGDDSDD
uniref:Transmembrane protein n=2 Tax=Noccaea caerulescens TaxID=107243 RepID=A0A1J3DRQ2_NOCCA